VNTAIDRRGFLKCSGIAALAIAIARPDTLIGGERDTGSKPGDLDFVFFTDTHIQPELRADEGCRKCFRQIAELHPAFAICGGDLVFDAAAVPRKRAGQLFDLYQQAEDLLGVPIYHTIGNHDVVGVFSRSGVSPTEPGYGKQMFEQRIGHSYYSFNRNGYHFIVLDSIFLTGDREWEARIDPGQLQWLAQDLAGIDRQTPIIAVSHVPLATSFNSYQAPDGKVRQKPTLVVTNAFEVLALLAPYRLIAVLQGHIHINEVVSYGEIQFITSGAVCGNWWRGPRWNSPEGFSVISLRSGTLIHRYETYGWKA
jgi:3',5'-cyclic AMP phosphodiesterase CpdA